MKHTAVITFHRATCSCGQMAGVWRGESEAIGIFTLRSDRAWREHVASVEDEVPLFDCQRPAEASPELPQLALF